MNDYSNIYIKEIETITKNNEKLQSENRKLKEENERLRKCHESELGVCYKHCEEVSKLKELLKEVHVFLCNERWGTIDYMEGSKVYSDIELLKKSVAKVLKDD